MNFHVYLIMLNILQTKWNQVMLNFCNFLRITKIFKFHIFKKRRSHNWCSCSEVPLANRMSPTNHVAPSPLLCRMYSSKEKLAKSGAQEYMYNEARKWCHCWVTLYRGRGPKHAAARQGHWGIYTVHAPHWGPMLVCSLAWLYVHGHLHHHHHHHHQTIHIREWMNMNEYRPKPRT